MNTWAYTAVVCTVMACMVEIAVSNTGTAGTVRFVLGLFLLCVVLVPLVQTAQSWIRPELSIPELSLPEESLQQQELQLLSAKLEKLTEEYLQKQGIQPRQITVTPKLSDSGEISGLYAEVILAEKDRSSLAAAEQLLFQELGMEGIVVIE